MANGLFLLTAANLQMLATSTTTSTNFTNKIKKIFCINVNKNVKEKFSLGFWVTKIKNDTA